MYKIQYETKLCKTHIPSSTLFMKPINSIMLLFVFYVHVVQEENQISQRSVPTLGTSGEG